MTNTYDMLLNPTLNKPAPAKEEKRKTGWPANQQTSSEEKHQTTEAVTKQMAETHATTIASHRDTKPPSHHDTTVSQHQTTTEPRSQARPNPSKAQATVVADNHATTVSRHHDTMTPATFETIRKAVKQLGKEAATHRFTEEEKRAIADIVYTYDRLGYRTSENEITRIAIHCLLQDYQQYGAHSVLARLLETLHK